jgi:hypothetical protein
MATITGTSSPNNLQGTDEADLMLAGEGNDTLEGHRGNDDMWGQLGDDTYIINPDDGRDWILDFNSDGRDTLVFNGFTTIKSFADLDGHITKTSRGTDYVIDVAGAEGVGGTQSVKVALSPLSADNVRFFTITPLPGAFIVEDPKDRRDPEIPTLEEELTDIKPPEPDPGWMFG